jgi:Flp pilus assembly protein TadD
LEKGGKPDSEIRPWCEKALSAINKAIHKEPNDPRAYHRRSLVYQQLDNFNQALLDIEKAISLDRKEPVYYMLDAFYLAKLGQRARAKNALDTYLLYRPDEAGADDVRLILETLKQKP